MTLPAPSTGVLMAPFDEQAVLYDPVAGRVHVLNPTARSVWQACTERWTFEQVVEALGAASGTDRREVSSGVDAYLGELSDAGLVGATASSAPQRVAAPDVERMAVSRVHAVIDDGVVFGSDDPTVLAAIDDLLGLMASERPVTVRFALDPEPDGSVALIGPGVERRYGSLPDLLEELPTTLNGIAAASETCLTLHAGAVVAPAGEVVVLPAVSGSGKTTLTASLVQAGWGYLTDEAIGIRAGTLEAVGYPKPLVLDTSSRCALGLAPSGSANLAVDQLRPGAAVTGPVPAVARVVLARYQAGAAASTTQLSPVEAFLAIAEHALNLRVVGQAGLDALVALALRTACHRLVHGGGTEAIEEVGKLLRSPRSSWDG